MPSRHYLLETRDGTGFQMPSRHYLLETPDGTGFRMPSGRSLSDSSVIVL